MAGSNEDEKYILYIANKLERVKARFAKDDEDYGTQKADVVLTVDGITIFLQVSHQPKSKKEVEKLLKRGTFSIHTHRFLGIPLTEKNLQEKIHEIIKQAKEIKG